MARIKNMRPTVIYWLVDTRTNTPFYCGKTVNSPQVRLRGHRSAAKSRPYGLVGLRVIECGENIRMQIMETVPSDGDWVAREKRWIWLLRGSFSGCVNVSEGGQGGSGVIPSIETRRKQSVSHAGKKLPKEQCAKISAALTGLKRGPMSIEQREQMRAARIGKKQKPEHVAKRAASNTGRKRSSETRARMSAWQIGKTISVEQREKLRAAAFRQHARMRASESANG